MLKVCQIFDLKFFINFEEVVISPKPKYPSLVGTLEII